MGITYQEEKIKNCLEEMEPMLKQHWEELANHKDTRPLDPDYQTYLDLNDKGIIKMYTVRSDDKLIGYSIWVIANHLHYKTWLYANSDVYWLDYDYRKTGISFEFFFKIEDWLKSLGVKSITVQDKLQYSHNNFFTRVGYTPIEKNYEKVL